MTSWGDLHGEAMDLSDRALRHQRRGEHDPAMSLFERALHLEREALSLMGDIGEPIYSTMYRSAATLALDCKEYRLAERLASRALAEDPPGYLVRELREVVEQANFHTHLRLDGVELSDSELQVSVSGSRVGYGTVMYDDWEPRLDAVRKLIYRVWDRTFSRQHGEVSGSGDTSTSKLALAMSSSRSGSMAVTFKIGLPDQISLPGVLESDRLIEGTLDVVETVANCDSEDALSATYPDEVYRRNFFNLVKRIAPDGDRVRQVGFTAVAAGSERRVPLRRTRSDFRTTRSRSTETTREMITGRLLFADGRNEKSQSIKIVEAGDDSREVMVPTGMMNDIVRPLWNEMVTAEVTVKGKTATLVGIEGV